MSPTEPSQHWFHVPLRPLSFIRWACLNKETTLRVNTSSDQARAQALFKKEERLRDGQKAMAEYEAAQRAIREKTARLRALRLARDAAAKVSVKPSVKPSDAAATPSAPSARRVAATRPGRRVAAAR